MSLVALRKERSAASTTKNKAGTKHFVPAVLFTFGGWFYNLNVIQN
jgi:hypothetical protein